MHGETLKNCELSFISRYLTGFLLIYSCLMLTNRVKTCNNLYKHMSSLKYKTVALTKIVFII